MMFSFQARLFPVLGTSFFVFLVLSPGGCALLPGQAQNPEPAAARRTTDSGEAVPYYVGVDDLPLYPEPRAADAMRKLSLHEKVIRTRLVSGWAFVTVEGTGEQGWVDNARLIWRLPPENPTGTDGGAEDSDEQQAAPANTAVTVEKRETPETAPAATGSRPPSLLDSY